MLADRHIEALMHSARLHSKEGNWIASLNIYNRIIGENPKFFPAYCELARLYIDRDDFNSARNLVQKILIHEPGNAEASFLLGVIEYVEGNFEEALRAYRNVEKKEGLDVNLAMNIALVCEALGLYHDAIKHLEFAISKGEANVRVYEVLADLLRAVGQYDREEAFLENAVRKFPAAASLYFNLGMARLKKHNLIKAETAFKTASRLEPEDIGPIDELIRIYVRTGRTADAVPLLSRLIEIDVDNVQNWLRLARAYFSLGQCKKSVEILKEAKRIFPNSASIYKELANAMRAMENKKGDKGAPEGRMP